MIKSYTKLKIINFLKRKQNVHVMNDKIRCNQDITLLNSDEGNLILYIFCRWLVPIILLKVHIICTRKRCSFSFLIFMYSICLSRIFYRSRSFARARTLHARTHNKNTWMHLFECCVCVCKTKIYFYNIYIWIVGNLYIYIYIKERTVYVYHT